MTRLGPDLGEDPIHRGRVGEVDLMERHARRHVAAVAAREVVDDVDVGEPLGDVRADEPRAPGDDDAHSPTAA
jgi:hypothetical protein